MSTRSRIAGRVALSVASVAALSGGCAALNQFQHAATLTFRVDTMECGAPKGTGTVCAFFAYYGNVSKKAIQVDPTTTKVIDRKGNVLQPVAEEGTGDSFLLKPGAQHQISWSLTLPSTAKPAKVTWHGSSVPVLLDTVVASVTPSAAPSASVVPSLSPAVTPSITPEATTPSPTKAKPTSVRPTTTKPKPTTTKPTVKPSPTTPRPTTTAPITKAPTTPPPPPRTTTHAPVTHHTTPPTTNPTNPGGGSGGIG